MVSLPGPVFEQMPNPTQRFVVPPCVYTRKHKIHRFADPPCVYKRKGKELPSTAATDKLPLAVSSGTNSSFSSSFVRNLASTTTVPTNDHEAMSHPDWHKAMQDEISALTNNQT